MESNDKYQVAETISIKNICKGYVKKLGLLRFGINIFYFHSLIVLTTIQGRNNSKIAQFIDFIWTKKTFGKIRRLFKIQAT